MTFSKFGTMTVVDESLDKPSDKEQLISQFSNQKNSPHMVIMSHESYDESSNNNISPSDRKKSVTFKRSRDRSPSP